MAQMGELMGVVEVLFRRCWDEVLVQKRHKTAKAKTRLEKALEKKKGGARKMRRQLCPLPLQLVLLRKDVFEK